MRSAGGGQAEVRIQPRQALRLRAGRDRADRDSRRLSTGLRGHGRQHLGQDDAAGFSGQDRGAIRQRQTHLGDGSRHPDRGGPGGDASLADAHPLSRGHAARTADQAGKGACGQAVGRRARERAGQVDRTGAGDLRLRPQSSPAREGTGDAAASVAQADQTPARTARAEPDARRAVAEARRSQKGGRQGLRAADDPYADEGSAGHPAQTFHFALDRKKLRIARRREGGYLLRSNIRGDDPGHLWRLYLQLVEIEQAFKELKNDLSIRPIHHQLEDRIEAHIFVAFLAYGLMVTLKQRLKALAPGLTPRAVLEKLAAIQMIDVELPTTDSRTVVLARHTEPENDHLLLLQRLKLDLPAQPPPKITAPPFRPAA